ncbi:unnamed protein product [Chrysoparadoxa australica]
MSKAQCGAWLVEACRKAEECTAVMKHVQHPHPALRALSLLQVGQLRFKMIQQQSHLVEVSQYQAAAASALKAAIQVSYWRGGHDYNIIHSACRSLVDLYSYNHGSEGPETPESSAKSQELAGHFQQLGTLVASKQRSAQRRVKDISGEDLSQGALQDMPRSVLDELAGPSTKSQGNDYSKLSTSSVLHFLLAKGRERLVSPPSLILQATTAMCEVHALLSRHAPVYFEECCLAPAELKEPSHKD